MRWTNVLSFKIKALHGLCPFNKYPQSIPRRQILWALLIADPRQEEVTKLGSLLMWQAMTKSILARKEYFILQILDLTPSRKEVKVGI